MSLMSPARFQRSLVRTPVILQGLLSDVDNERARTATDGPDGWSVLQVVCHLRDFEGFFRGRAELALTQANPRLPAYDHEQIAIDRDYQSQDVREALTTFIDERKRFLRLMQSLNNAQWVRMGLHPELGWISVLDMAMQVALHDVDHIEQITRCLDLAERFEV